MHVRRIKQLPYPCPFHMNFSSSIYPEHPRTQGKMDLSNRFHTASYMAFPSAGSSCHNIFAKSDRKTIQYPCRLPAANNPSTGIPASYPSSCQMAEHFQGSLPFVVSGAFFPTHWPSASFLHLYLAPIWFHRLTSPQSVASSGRTSSFSPLPPSRRFRAADIRAMHFRSQCAVPDNPPDRV